MVGKVENRYLITYKGVLTDFSVNAESSFGKRQTIEGVLTQSVIASAKAEIKGEQIGYSNRESTSVSVFARNSSISKMNTAKESLVITCNP